MARKKKIDYGIIAAFVAFVLFIVLLKTKTIPNPFDGLFADNPDTPDVDEGKRADMIAAGIAGVAIVASIIFLPVASAVVLSVVIGAALVAFIARDSESEILNRPVSSTRQVYEVD